MKSVHFTCLDYIFFISVFVITIATALYYAFNTQKRRSIEEYLFGGKNLKVIPVSFSLAATAISGSATIGQSMEVYAYGIHNWMILVNSVTWVIIMHFVFLPVFYELQLTSTFTYLEMRFDKSVKYLASSLYVLTGCFILPLTIYVPALAFQELTGINLYVISIAMGLLCIWYTAVGGIRAVIITDMFQFCIILISAIVILIVGLKSVGGIGNVWEALERGKRLTIVKSDLDFEARGTIWAYLFSNVFVLLYYFGVSQSSVQRFISLPSIKEAKIALWCQSILCKTILLLQFIIGAIIYTTYEDCDPLTSGVVKKIDQIFPHYIQEKASLFSGFSGIFIAGIFAAGLSTASTLLNTISGTIYNDFLRNTFKKTDFEKVMKITVAGLGIVGIVMVFLIQQMGTIFAITFQCFTLSTVGVLGLFASGILFPNINSKGAKCGVVVSMLVVGTLIIGGLSKKPDPLLPLRTDGCDFQINGTNFLTLSLDKLNSSTQLSNPLQLTNSTQLNSDIYWIFRINFQWHCLIGLLCSICIGSLVSALTKGSIVEDQRLFATFLRKKDVAKPLLGSI